MLTNFKNFFGRLSLSWQFMLASLVILVGGMLGLGAWVGAQIELGVINRTAATTALFVDSFIAPNLQELADGNALTREHAANLARLVQEPQMGQKIVAFRVWDVNGRVMYSNEPASIGQVFPIEEGLAQALNGEVVTQISDLQKAENLLEKAQQSRLLETYSPVRLGGTNRIIAVAEFYQKVDPLQQEINAAQQRSWLVVGLAMLLMYILLAGFVRRASDTIEGQRAALGRQVDQLTELLGQNESLRERIRRAAGGFTTLNERFLRRFSAELHDGPLQDLGLALLRMDHVEAAFSAARNSRAERETTAEDLNVIEASLRRAMDEIRSLSAGLGVPQLNELSLPETVARAVHVHEQRTHSEVALSSSDLPEQASLPVKITVYRLIQEALHNAYRHAQGLGQQVQVSCRDGMVTVQVSDQGPGFIKVESSEWDQHLGLVGMRERVESLGGSFRLESAPGQGTRVIANLPLRGANENEENR